MVSGLSHCLYKQELNELLCSLSRHTFVKPVGDFKFVVCDLCESLADGRGVMENQC